MPNADFSRALAGVKHLPHTRHQSVNQGIRRQESLRGRITALSEKPAISGMAHTTETCSIRLSLHSVLRLH